MPLTFVPTPLGNLRDITLRALDALETAELVVAEDTRVAARLLSALKIAGKPIWSYREQNAAAATAGILSRAASGSVAVVTDAGMPGISDPGRELIVAAKAAGVAIDVLPGPTAFVGAAVLSGFAIEPLVFAGFVSRSQTKRRAAFGEAAARAGTTVYYESPARIATTLDDLRCVAPEARVFLLREYTKRFEEHLEGTAADILSRLPENVRGEIAFAVEGIARSPRALTREEEDAAIDAALARGESSAAIAKSLSAAARDRRGELYNRIAARKREP